MSFLDIALMVSVPLGAVAITVTYRFRKGRSKKRALRNQRKLL
jgi:hypothetical protein